jgi:murein DD-endopeptidase MepM/ murein hydrolase activator NlpD
LLLSNFLSRLKGKWLFLSIALLLICGIAVYFFIYEYVPQVKNPDTSMIDTLKAEKEIIRLYGIPVDSFDVKSDIIRRDETLLTILNKYNLPKGSLQKLLTIEKPAFDLRKIKAGNKFFVFQMKDSIASLRYFVYEHSPLDFVIFTFGDSVSIHVGQKKLVTKQQIAVGKINTSLWNAMIDKGYNPLLANELSEIYAWSIDFFGLQPADSFSVVYDELYVDSVSVGLGRVHAAYFKSSGTEFYAIPFTQDSVESFFDVEGKSLRKAFLKAPLRFSRISSRYSNSRMHPILKIRRPHHGVDYAAPSGTPVQAIGDGKVIEAKRGYNNGGGNMLKIKHNSVYSTAYLHLSGFAPSISSGKYVKQGEVIGYVGTTGLSSGPHLDFRFYKNGSPIDPLKVEAPPVEPVHTENMGAFDSVKTNTLNLLHITAKLYLRKTSH